MTPLRQQMLAALQLSGKGERTQESYVREVRLLAQFYHKSPDRITEQELQHYCNLSLFVARKHWLRRRASPPCLGANLVKRGELQRG
jgi:Phage integrase, N-terminal SAM-like domain